MIEIASKQDLQQVGITYLTGEACALGTRFLAGLSEDAARGIESYFGLHNVPFSDFGAARSMMLPRDFGFLMDLAGHLLYAQEWSEIFILDDKTLYAMTSEDFAKYIREEREVRITKRFRPICPAQPRDGANNVHAITGRSM